MRLHEELLIRQLRRKFGSLAEEHAEKIRLADQETVERWAEQILFAATPEEVMR